MVLRIAARRFDDWCARYLDPEGVGFFQVLVYSHMVVCGLYCLLVAGGVPQVVAEVLGPAMEKVWLWLFVGSSACVLGKVMARTNGTRPVWMYTAGMWLQLVGDIAACGGFTAYVLATFQTAYWGKAVVAAFGFSAYAWCTLFLIVRDVRRIQQAERVVRQ